MEFVGQKAAKLLAFKVGGLQKKSAAQPNKPVDPDSSSPGVESFSKFDGW